ncbi:MAG: hypothetical protein ABIR70_09770 [Bryobacteraceae bacterium]
MRTKTFLFVLGASSLLAAPVSNNWIEQHAKAKLGIYTSQPTTARQALQAPENWMEQNLHAKIGRFSPAEEARTREVQNSSAFRQEISRIPTTSWIERNRQVKQGQ